MYIQSTVNVPCKSRRAATFFAAPPSFVGGTKPGGDTERRRELDVRRIAEVARLVSAHKIVVTLTHAQSYPRPRPGQVHAYAHVMPCATRSHFTLLSSQRACVCAHCAVDS